MSIVKIRNICLLILVSVFGFLLNNNVIMTNAETFYTEYEKISSSEPENEGEEESSGVEGPVFEGFVITESVMPDEYLYLALLDEYSDYYFEINGVEYEGNQIYSDMFVDVENINLDKCNISSLQGLEKLELDNLKSFSANSNALTSFSSSSLQIVDHWQFTNLSLADNQLTSVNLSNLKGLTNINLSSNKLSAIDFSCIEGRSGGSEVTINVANNIISNFDNLKLPETRILHTNLNIINNNILDIPEKYFGEGYTTDAGIQGFIGEDVVNTDTARNLTIYKVSNPALNNLFVSIIKIDADVFETISTISLTEDIEGNFLKLDLSVGQYKFKYLQGTRTENEEAYTKDYSNKYFLKEVKFGVVPQKVGYKFIHKNKEYSELGKVTGKVTVELQSYDVNSKVYYQINNGEWIEGTTIQCDGGGNYSIKVKSVVDGVESDVQSIWVRTSLNLYIPDALMLAFVLLLALVLFLVVLPIVSKKYFKKD